MAPVAFRHSGLSRDLAGNVVGGSLARFNLVLYALGALLLLAEIVEWAALARADGRWRRLAALRALAVAGMLGLALYLGLALTPAMFRTRAAGEMGRFDAQHRRYAMLADVELLLALGASLLATIQASSTAPARRAAEPGAAEPPPQPATR